MSDRGRSEGRGAAMRRRVTTMAIGCTLLCTLIARPAYADPADPHVPSPGSRPVADSTLPLPGLPTTPGTVPSQPKVPLTELRRKADSAASEAYKAAVAMGPLGEYADDLHKLSQLAPGIGEQPGGEALAREVAEAERVEQTTHAAYLSASTAEQAAFAKWQQLDQQRAQRAAVLADLLARNSAALAREEAEREARDQLIGAQLNVGRAVDGLVANPKAIAALQFALRQRGKAYEFGAEGPLHFDCSGLMLAAYESVGYRLPRVSSEQYHALKPVAIK